MLRLFLLSCCLFTLSACNSVKPHLDVYDGLLPAGYKLKESPNPINTAELKSKTLVLVTTTNFNNYTTTWQDYYEKGREEQQKGTMRATSSTLTSLDRGAGVANSINSVADAVDKSGNKVRSASDPRNVVDRVNAALRPYFKSVGVAADFAEARNLKPDYIALVDYHFTANAMGSAFLTWCGVYMLDGSLRHVFQSEVKAEVERDTGSVFTYSSIIDGTANTYSKAIDIVTSQVISDIRVKLGPAPIEKVTQVQTPAPEFKNDKGATQRIEELNELKKKGFISEAEFQAKKNKIIEGL